MPNVLRRNKECKNYCVSNTQKTAWTTTNEKIKSILNCNTNVVVNDKTYVTVNESQNSITNIALQYNEQESDFDVLYNNNSSNLLSFIIKNVQLKPSVSNSYKSVYNVGSKMLTIKIVVNITNYLSVQSVSDDKTKIEILVTNIFGNKSETRSLHIPLGNDRIALMREKIILPLIFLQGFSSVIVSFIITYLPPTQKNGFTYQQNINIPYYLNVNNVPTLNSYTVSNVKTSYGLFILCFTHHDGIELKSSAGTVAYTSPIIYTWYSPIAMYLNNINSSAPNGNMIVLFSGDNQKGYSPILYSFTPLNVVSSAIVISISDFLFKMNFVLTNYGYTLVNALLDDNTNEEITNKTGVTVNASTPFTVAYDDIKTVLTSNDKTLVLNLYPNTNKIAMIERSQKVINPLINNNDIADFNLVGVGNLNIGSYTLDFLNNQSNIYANCIARNIICNVVSQSHTRIIVLPEYNVDDYDVLSDNVELYLYGDEYSPFYTINSNGNITKLSDPDTVTIMSVNTL